MFTYAGAVCPIWLTVYVPDCYIQTGLLYDFVRPALHCPRSEIKQFLRRIEYPIASDSVLKVVITEARYMTYSIYDSNI